MLFPEYHWKNVFSSPPFSPHVLHVYSHSKIFSQRFLEIPLPSSCKIVNLIYLEIILHPVMVTFITMKWKRFLKFYLAKMALFFVFLIVFTVYIYWLFKRPSSGDPHANLEKISVHHSFRIFSTVFGVLLFLHLIVHLLWEVFLYKKPRHRNSPHDLMMLFTEGVEMGTDVGIFPLHC